MDHKIIRKRLLQSWPLYKPILFRFPIHSLKKNLRFSATLWSFRTHFGNPDSEALRSSRKVYEHLDVEHRCQWWRCSWDWGTSSMRRALPSPSHARRCAPTSKFSWVNHFNRISLLFTCLNALFEPVVCKWYFPIFRYIFYRDSPSSII